MNAPETDHAARRQRLAVLCALDRVELRLALKPPRPPQPLMVAGVKRALDVAAVLPGRLGRWSRHLATGLRLARQVQAAMG
jgi:hypothetical protein